MFYDFDDLRALAHIIDEYLGFKSNEELIEKIIYEYTDSSDALIDLLVYLVLIPHHKLEELVNIFIDKPIEEMPRYTSGPSAWQVVLARWRLQLQR